MSDEVAEKAQQRWEESDLKAKRFCLIKPSKRLACFERLGHKKKVVRPGEDEDSGGWDDSE